MTAIDEIYAERIRQITQEGWARAHDDRHTDGSLAQAAGCYALVSDVAKVAKQNWPKSWHPSWFKPRDRRRNLIRAAALLVAEIERIDRAAHDAARKETK